MPDYDPATYGDRMADVYDQWFGIPGDTEDTVNFLGELAGRGPALELGISTGRVALPLVQRGKIKRTSLQLADRYLIGAPIAW